jgi:hypothetical protein
VFSSQEVFVREGHLLFWVLWRFDVRIPLSRPRKSLLPAYQIRMSEIERSGVGACESGRVCGGFSSQEVFVREGHDISFFGHREDLLHSFLGTAKIFLFFWNENVSLGLCV